MPKNDKLQKAIAEAVWRTLEKQYDEHCPGDDSTLVEQEEYEQDWNSIAIQALTQVISEVLDQERKQK